MARLNHSNELSPDRVFMDARTMGDRFAAWVTKPGRFGLICWGYLVFNLLMPFFFLATLPFFLLFLLWFARFSRALSLPLRYPEWTNHLDPASYDQRRGPKLDKASGYYFLGNERRDMRSGLVDGDREIWVSDSDLRTHRLLMGATGSGKTVALMSWMLNPLCFGSGFTYVDGKAETNVWFNFYRMASAMWREDDIRVVNYMTGGVSDLADPVTGMRKRRSNSMNPFGRAGHNTINQILGSMMAKASGDGASWHAKAVNMMNAVTQALCALREAGAIQVSTKTIRENMSLNNIIDIVTKRGDVSPDAIEPLRQYLAVGLPGFNMDLVKAGKPQGQQTMDQHGFLTGQFTRTLGMFGDTYGHIFNDPLPEIDMLDIVLKNRILVVMIPTMEKSPEEAANLGKVVVTSAKMMMGVSLGADVEGTYTSAIENKPINDHRPYEIVLDELGYYFAEGMDLMFAQARSLKIALTASGQDFQAMAKQNRNEVDSVIANTHLKIPLKVEDTKETSEVFIKAVGEASVAQSRGLDDDEGAFSASLTADRNASIHKEARLTIQDLKGFDPGSGAIIYRDRMIFADMFNIGPDLEKMDKESHVRINTMLPIMQPKFGNIAVKCRSPKMSVVSRMRNLLKSRRPPRYRMDSASVHHTMISEIREMSNLMGENPIPASERGIALFMAAVNALDRAPAPVVTPVDLAPTQADISPRDVSDIDEAAIEGEGSKEESNPLSFLDEPPMFLSDGDEKPSSAQADIGKPRADEDGEDEEFGERIDEKSLSKKGEIGLRVETRDAIGRIAVGVAGGGGIDIAEEVESVRKTASDVCRFDEANKGRNDAPSAFETMEDLEDALSRLNIETIRK